MCHRCYWKQKRSTKIQLERFKNGCLELAMTELQGRVKVQVSTYWLVVVIQPVLLRTCVRSKSLYCQRVIFLSHRTGRVILTLKVLQRGKYKERTWQREMLISGAIERGWDLMHVVRKHWCRLIHKGIYWVLNSGAESWRKWRAYVPWPQNLRGESRSTNNWV